MMKAHLGNGSIVVNEPDEKILRSLVRFRHANDGSGEYEDLYSYSSDRDIMVTMPGFAKRISKMVDRVVDERVRMPDPDRSTYERIDGAWRPVIEKAVEEGGGIISVPDVFGIAGAAAAIIGAYPKDGLIDRSTPMCLVAVGDADTARSVGYELRKLMPEREVGINRSDSEDIVVASFSTMRDVMLSAVGILVCAIDGPLKDAAESLRAESISSVRNAARWGVASSPFGGPYDPDMAEEGLFGPFVASATYDDAVKAGTCAPVTVCWLPAPRPNAPSVSAPLEVLEKIAHDDNPMFADMVKDIFRATPNDVGMLMQARKGKLSRFAPLGVLTLDKKNSDRKRVIEDIVCGTIRKAVVQEDLLPRNTRQAMIASSCGGISSVRNFPCWIKDGEGDRAFVVDFMHEWDVHNGRKGRLAMNDDARKSRYREMGFSQVALNGIDELPFVR